MNKENEKLSAIPGSSNLSFCSSSASSSRKTTEGRQQKFSLSQKLSSSFSKNPSPRVSLRFKNLNPPGRIILVKTRAEWRPLKPFSDFVRGNSQFISDVIKTGLETNPNFKGLERAIGVDYFQEAARLTELIKETPEFRKQCFEHSVVSSLREIEQRSLTEKNLPSNYQEIRNNLLEKSKSWEKAKSFLDNLSIGRQVYNSNVFIDEEIHEIVGKNFETELVSWAREFTQLTYTQYSQGNSPSLGQIGKQIIVNRIQQRQAAKNPIVEQQIVQEPVVEQPVVEQPIVTEQIVEQQIVQQPGITEQKDVSEIPAKQLMDVYWDLCSSALKKQQEQIQKTREMVLMNNGKLAKTVLKALKNREDFLVSAAKIQIDPLQEGENSGVILYLKDFPVDTSVVFPKDFEEPNLPETVFEVDSAEEANKKIIDLTSNSNSDENTPLDPLAESDS